MGQQPFFHADQKHGGKLQPFGRVQGHQRHPVGFQLRRVDVRHQGHMIQKSFQRIFLIAFSDKFPGHSQEFLQVFHPALCFRRPLLLQFGQVSRFFHHAGNQVGDRFLAGRFPQPLHQPHQLGQRAFGFGADRRHSVNSLGHFKQGKPGLIRRSLQIAQRRITDAAPGNIDDPPETDRIGRILDQTQVGQHVLDFLAVIELYPAHDRIGNALFQERFLHRP